jgi:hypothetical protein
MAALFVFWKGKVYCHAPSLCGCATGPEDGESREVHEDSEGKKPSNSPANPQKGD